MEDRFLKECLAKEPPLTPAGQKLYEYFNSDQNHIKKRQTWISQVNLRDFIDESKASHTKEAIQKDIDLVLEARKKKQDHTERGILFEEIFEKFGQELLSNSQFKINIFKTEDYDDRFNSIDFILEFKSIDKEPFYIGIDTTVSDNTMNVREKTLKTSAKLKNKGRLGGIKYYQSQSDNTRKRLIHVPRVVIALIPRRLDSLAKSALDAIEKNDSDQMTDASEFSNLIIERIITGLRANEDWVKEYINEIFEKKGDYAKMLGAVQTALENMQKIQKEKAPQQ